MNTNIYKACLEINQVLEDYLEVLKKDKEHWYPLPTSKPLRCPYPHQPELVRSRKVVLNQEEHICSICGKATIEIHHIDWSKENHDPTNLLIICHWCHLWLHSCHKKYLKGMN